MIFGLFLHGMCYDFYFVASYIYVDTRVNERQRASAQSFIAFVMLGVGMFIGSIASGAIVDRYPPEILRDRPSRVKGRQQDAKPKSCRCPNGTRRARSPSPRRWS